MTDNSLSFTFDDLVRSEWEKTLIEIAPSDYFQYSQIFEKQAEQARDSYDVVREAVFTFLKNTTSLIWYRLDGVKNHYSNNTLNSYLDNAKESFCDYVFSEQHFQTLDKLIEITSDPEMRVRISDIVWICKPPLEKGRLLQIAKIASEAYLQSAKIFKKLIIGLNFQKGCVELHRLLY